MFLLRASLSETSGCPSVRRASPATRLASGNRMPQLASLKYCNNCYEANTIKEHANI